MITIETNLGPARIVERVDELPDPRCSTMYLDVETTSFDKTVAPFFPYNGHRIAGVALARDSEPGAWYVPYRHTAARWNLPIENCTAWLRDCARNKQWVNHNVKFDAHFCLMDGMDFEGEFIDTLTAARMHDSDRMNHGLKQLCREWCGLDMDEEQDVKAFLSGSKSKNYADVPADKLGEYACKDVMGNRLLWRMLDAQRPSQTDEIWRVEKRFTRTLYNIEKRGLPVDLDKVKLEKLRTLKRLIALADELQKLTGREYTDSAKNNYDVFCVQLGLPVLMCSETSGAPSFNKEVLRLYSMHPQVLGNETARRTVECVTEFRDRQFYLSHFLDGFLQYADEQSRVHAQYRQVVRTGRTACSSPNLQGVSPEARDLVVTDKLFVSTDASQVEFRIIVHYTNDAAAIQAYNTDPRTDFHSWVASQCSDMGLTRRPAKTLNFAMGYGAGKRKVVSTLAGDPDIMAEIGKQLAVQDVDPEKKDRLYRRMCEARGNELYHAYHDRFPGIRRLTQRAEENCRRRGFVFNWLGRRRHLPAKFARKAFNAVVQGGAMDYIKLKMNELDDISWPMIGEVHDEILSEISVEEYAERKPEMMEILNSTPAFFRVPLTWDVGTGRTWRQAAGK